MSTFVLIQVLCLTAVLVVPVLVLATVCMVLLLEYVACDQHI